MSSPLSPSSDTPEIRTVLFPVSDLAQAKAVYTALLGAAPQIDDSYYVGFDTGARDAGPRVGQHVGLLPGGGPQGLTSSLAYWHVRDIEEKIAELTAAGATVKDAPSDVGGGRLVATLIDPDGNLLGLLEDR